MKLLFFVLCLTGLVCALPARKSPFFDRFKNIPIYEVDDDEGLFTAQERNFGVRRNDQRKSADLSRFKNIPLVFLDGEEETLSRSAAPVKPNVPLFYYAEERTPAFNARKSVNRYRNVPLIFLNEDPESYDDDDDESIEIELDYNDDEFEEDIPASLKQQILVQKPVHIQNQRPSRRPQINRPAQRPTTTTTTTKRPEVAADEEISEEEETVDKKQIVVQRPTVVRPNGRPGRPQRPHQRPRPQRPQRPQRPTTSTTTTTKKPEVADGGAPASGAPASGAPAPGAPASGAPAPGAPVPGAPASGAPVAPAPGAPVVPAPGAPTATRINQNTIEVLKGNEKIEIPIPKSLEIVAFITKDGSIYEIDNGDENLLLLGKDANKNQDLKTIMEKSLQHTINKILVNKEESGKAEAVIEVDSQALPVNPEEITKVIETLTHEDKEKATVEEEVSTTPAPIEVKTEVPLLRNANVEIISTY